MKTITITAREFAELYGCSPRYVNQVLNRGDLIQFMVSTRRSGSTWLIDVLRDWYDSKQR